MTCNITIPIFWNHSISHQLSTRHFWGYSRWNHNFQCFNQHFVLGMDGWSKSLSSCCRQGWRRPAGLAMPCWQMNDEKRKVRSNSGLTSWPTFGRSMGIPSNKNGKFMEFPEMGFPPEMVYSGKSSKNPMKLDDLGVTPRFWKPPCDETPCTFCYGISWAFKMKIHCYQRWQLKLPCFSRWGQISSWIILDHRSKWEPPRCDEQPPFMRFYGVHWIHKSENGPLQNMMARKPLESNHGRLLTMKSLYDSYWNMWVEVQAAFWNWTIINWLVVWLPCFIFPFFLGMSNHPNWRTLIFFRGVAKNHQPSWTIQWKPAGEAGDISAGASFRKRPSQLMWWIHVSEGSDVTSLKSHYTAFWLQTIIVMKPHMWNHRTEVSSMNVG